MCVTGTTLTTHSQRKQSLWCHSRVDTQPGLELQIRPENYSKHHMLHISRAVLLNDPHCGSKRPIFTSLSSLFSCSQSSISPAAIWHKGSSCHPGFSRYVKKQLISNFMVLYFRWFWKLFNHLSPGTFCLFQERWNKATPNNSVCVCFWYTNFTGVSTHMKAACEEICIQLLSLLLKRWTRIQPVSIIRNRAGLESDYENKITVV